jgi:hypothetical protein
MKIVRQISRPGVLFSRSAVLSTPCPVPKTAGIYAWFFKEVPGIIPTGGCVVHNGLTRLYAGISPSSPNSRQQLQKRIRQHFRGNAYSSTLRLSLGVLLQAQSQFPLRRVGTGNRMTFGRDGENWLSEWMEQNAFVHWIEHPEPWSVEKEVLNALSLPLNIQHNRHHPFAARLSAMRSATKANAHDMPVVS